MSDQPKNHTPAYVSYSTFKNAIRDLALDGTVPSQVDHSVLRSMGGSNRKLFLAALRFFDLVDDESGAPSEQLRKLATADESEWRDYMQVLLQEKYGPLVEHLPEGTPNSLRDRFKDHFDGIGQTLVEPSIRFLLAAARDIGLPVSGHLKQRKPRTRGGAKQRTTKSPKSVNVPREPEPTPRRTLTFQDALLEKFPEFDPEWPDAHKTAWFEAFGKLMEMTATNSADGDSTSGGTD